VVDDFVSDDVVALSGFAVSLFFSDDALLPDDDSPVFPFWA
jgi:hypothetical protein